MGSFSYTCTVSSLPIAAGDPVRYFLLTENPYEDSRSCLMHDLWFPRTFPLKGTYDDYGGVEDIEAGPGPDVWVEGFQRDLVERGWGDNSCHDMAIRKKGLTFSLLMEALQENRLLVVRDTSTVEPRSMRKLMRTKIPVGVPTRNRVETRLTKAGLPLYRTPGKESDTQSGFMVDNRHYGEIRVRWAAWGGEYGKDVEWLGKAQAVLSDYATMIRAGTGSYAQNGEMLVCVKPGTKDYHGFRKDRKKPLRIDHAMIREDVWQALLTLTINDNFNTRSKNIGVDSYRRGVKDAYDAMIKDKSFLHYAKSDLPSISGFRAGMAGVDMLPGAWVFKDVIPFTVGLGTHIDMMFQKGACTDDFLDSIAEFAFIQDALMYVRYYWRPSYSTGPQFGEWDRHSEIFKKFLQVSDNIAEEERRQRAEWEVESEEDE